MENFKEITVEGNLYKKQIGEKLDASCFRQAQYGIQ
jgi:hypothetical protein